MSETVTFPARFNGGPGFAHGGYLAGTMAELVGAPARATFRAPTPLETPMQVERSGDTVRLVTPDGTMTVSAEPCEVSVSVPPLPSYQSIVAARPNYRPFQEDSESFPGEAKDTCFVCSAHRSKPDGVELYAAPIGDGALVAATWVPEEQYAEDGFIKDIFLWAMLDCPAGFGAMERITDPFDLMFTGQLAGNILAPVKAGEEHIALGWHTGSDGRKHAAGSAICDLDGNIKAVSESLWIVTEKRP